MPKKQKALQVPKTVNVLTKVYAVLIGLAGVIIFWVPIQSILIEQQGLYSVLNASSAILTLLVGLVMLVSAYKLWKKELMGLMLAFLLTCLYLLSFLWSAGYMLSVGSVSPAPIIFTVICFLIFTLPGLIIYFKYRNFLKAITPAERREIRICYLVILLLAIIFTLLPEVGVI